MPKTLPTLDKFLAALPADRRATMTTVHKAIRKAVPKLEAAEGVMLYHLLSPSRGRHA